jgi:hypothetical protein|tara:strand:- start:160 stop:369 length:210 start_codon:yes stop_codon:yes gene_type:complete
MKKNKNNIKKALMLVNKIQNIRSKNNKNWMDLLKLSLKLDINTTSKILKDIVLSDRKISQIAEKIYKLK